MAKDNQILIRINDPMNEAVEEFAEDRDYNKAEASRKILESRLKGEGYLRRHYGDNDLEPMPDGGEIKNQLNSVHEEVNSVQEEVKEQNQYQSYLNLTFAVTALWFVVYFTFGFTPLWTAITGIPLVCILAYLVYQEWS